MSSKSLPIVLFAGAATLAVAACVDKPAATRAGGASGSVATDTVKRQGRWSDSLTAESDYTVAYVNGQPVVVEERMVFPDGMRSARTYLYDDGGAPARIIEERTLTAASGNSTPTMLRARIAVYFTGDRVDSSGKTVDNIEKTVQPYEIENLRRHEREIFARLSTTSTAPRSDR